jgi:hypothetical protein
MGLFSKLTGASPPPEPKERPSLTRTMSDELGVQPRTIALDDPAYRGSPIGWSHDLERIIKLPRRVLPKCAECGPVRERLKQLQREFPDQVAAPVRCKVCGDSGLDPVAARAWTEHLRRERTLEEGPCDCREKFGFCISELKAIQGWALEEASNVGGSLGFIGAGHGKTGIVILMPLAIPDVKVAVALVQSSLKPQFLRDYMQWSAHFTVPNLAGGRFFVPGRPVLHVVTYHELSNKRSTNLFSRINPDLVITDEAHNVNNPESTRGIRFERVFEQPKKRVRYAAQSGTLTKKSIKEIGHHARHALGEGSPVPVHEPTLDEWSAALDAGDKRAPAGHLQRLCRPGQSAREGFRDRLVETPGVIATEESALGTTLILGERKLATVPADVLRLIREVVDLNRRPDGEELLEAIEIHNAATQLASGFYYKWRFPRGETEQMVDLWLDARKNFRKEVRLEMKRGREHMDSPLLITQAAIRWHDGYNFHKHRHTDECFELTLVPHRHTAGCEGLCFEEIDTLRGAMTCTQQETSIFIPPHTRNGPLLIWESEFWPRWKELKDSVQPVTEAVWVSDFLVADAVEWLKSGIGIMWYEHDAFGREVAKRANVPHYGPGVEASTKIVTEKGKRSIVASIRAHGTGKNLQMFSRNLIGNCPSDGAATEQLLARTHRPGQNADQVEAEFYLHTEQVIGDFLMARGRAQYIYETTGNPQKLLYGNYTFDWKGLSNAITETVA